jgi:hypothetical protein
MASRLLLRLSVAIVTVLCVIALSNSITRADVRIFGPLCAEGSCGPWQCASTGTGYSFCFDFLPSRSSYGATVNKFASFCGTDFEHWNSFFDGTCGTDAVGGQHMQQTADAGPFGYFIHQPDGNAVVYDGFNNPVWHTHTNGWGQNTQFILTNGGQLILYYNQSFPLWRVD